MAINMGFNANKQAYPLLKALVQDLTGRTVEVANIGDYINVMSSLREQYNNPDDFFNSVYTCIRARVKPVAWEISEHERPYSFVEMSRENVAQYLTEGIVFDRPIDEHDYVEDKFTAPGEGDTGYSASDEDALNVRQWRKKDYITDVLATGGEANFKDHITYYRKWLVSAMTDPFEFYNMWSAIKSQWHENWKQYKSVWEMNTFLNLLTATRESTNADGDATRTIKLLTEYNSLFGKNLTTTNWRYPENIKEFSPWAYIRINQVVRMMEGRNGKYMSDLKKEFRGKTYEWIYPCKKEYITSAFLEEPFLLMKSYSNAEVFNEGDLEKISVNYLPYWQFPDDGAEKYKVKVGTHLAISDGSVSKVSAPLEFTDVIGIIYDKRSIGTSYYDEWEKDTGLNAETGHGNIHIHATVSNFINPHRKAVVFSLS